MSKGGRSTSRQKNERPGGPDRKVINLSIGSTEVKLHQSENAWKPTQKNKVEDPDEAKTQVCSSVLVIINYNQVLCIIL